MHWHTTVTLGAIEKLYAWSSIKPEQVSEFAKIGYLVIRNFTSVETCRCLRRAILDYAQHKAPIEVRWKESTFDTFNGDEVDQNLPALRQLYDRHLLMELNKLFAPLATISDRRVGISINMTSTGGKFQSHFDRHNMTAILYINDDFVGGEMRFYPRVRYWLGHPTGSFKQKLQRVLDRMVRSKHYLKWLAKGMILTPKEGDLLIFEGTRTYHGVTPVNGPNTRITVQFGYDRPGTTYDVSQYYGK